MEPQEYDDCDPGYCPKCLDVCLEEEGIIVEGITTYSLNICPACGHITDFTQVDVFSDSDWKSIIPPYGG
jgi:hypothetical protein